MRANPFVKSALVFSVIGMATSLVLPMGWMSLSYLLGSQADERLFLSYVTVAATCFGAVFGAVLGVTRERVRLLSERDDLTGLFNQSAFLRTASFLLHLAVRHNEPLAVMMLDLDHFKEVNDKHNHLVGSYVLKQVARIITETTRKSDLTARFGGDEYVFCLPRTDLKQAAEVADRIRAAISAKPFETRGHAVKVTASIGVAAARATAGLELNHLIELADKALYTAKAQGRNRVMTLMLNA
jgi:diguanylate cyclase (GGDEF)-like protein